MLRIYTIISLVLLSAISQLLQAQSEPLFLLSKPKERKTTGKTTEKTYGILNPKRFESRFKSSKPSIGAGVSIGYFDAYIDDYSIDSLYDSYNEVYAEGLGIYGTFSKKVLWHRLKFNSNLGLNVYRNKELKATTLYLDTDLSLDIVRIHIFSVGMELGIGMLAARLNTDEEIDSPNRYATAYTHASWFFRAEISEQEQLKLAFIYREDYYWNSSDLVNFSYSYKF